MTSVLIITSRTDVHCNRVLDYLDDAGISWFRLNSEDLAGNLFASISPAEGSGILKVPTHEGHLDLRDVRCVWFRKPEPVDVSQFQLDPAALDYIQAEFDEFLNNLYALLSDRVWINNPLLSRIAHRKLWQLHVARRVGLNIPKTIISNNEQDILRFSCEVGGDLAIKSLSALHATISLNKNEYYDYGLFTRRVTQRELEDAREFMQHMPTVIQEYVDKKFELRVTSVSGKHLACRIDTQSSDLSKEDSRINIADLPHYVYDLPNPISEKLTAYMCAMGLNFGCHDIIVDKNDKHVFLECNPNGQWMWIERLTGLNISKQLAAFLSARARGT
jgi:glutathione synthase/RimK-type ligase-like ATP-grasp enzyme